MMKRIVSLLPAGTEIAAALGLMEEVVGVSHECDFPPAANERPRVTHCPFHRAGLTSKEVDYWVRTTLQERGTLYTIDEPLLRRLQPDIILTQQLCDVCAVGYGTVARLAATLPVPPRLVNLEPSSLADIFNDIRRVAEACAVPERGSEVVRRLTARVESVRRRAAVANRQRKCFLMEWVQPPFSSGHWGPELIELAGAYDSLGRKWQPSVGLAWEQIVEAQPEVIILALCGYDIERAEKDYEVLRAFPDFADLPAARDNEIYLTDASSYFARPGPRIVDSLEIVAGILHPDLFPEFAPTATTSHKVRRAN
ncbi:MAG: ABC transporter substrate-binding protein [Chthoniobacterales bacterium]|nr:ABC transporter substrate-binding protein [Chthoniobacterales bacterium]